MTRYQIASKTSGALIGTFEADSIDAALNMMAREMGYSDYRDSALISTMGNETPEEIEEMVERDRADLDITEVA